VKAMKKILDKSNMAENDWQEYRSNQQGIGGSDASIILGLNPFKSAFTLWLEKTGQIKAPNLQDNEYVEWGNLLEPVIREKFAKETGFEVFENHFVLQHDEHPFMVANLDGEVIDPQFGGEKGVLEIKTTSERNKKDWEEGCPDHYMLQVQHYLAVTGYPYGYIVVLIGGHHFKYFLIHRDDYVIDRIISAEMDFQEKVEKNISPQITGHEGDSDFLAEKYLEDNGEEFELSPEFEKIAWDYIQTQQEIKYLQEESDTLKNQLKLYAGEAKRLKGEKIKINLPTIKKISFDSKRFALDYPELYEQYKTKESSYRSFTISPIK
jgi:putative phage-type endonuclease